ncbi:hypothetical protein B0H13DRAFT_2276505 [Mycena leptocephala]|nr:hypothetical protein B0H13DRAFT_2276505 [Mycena leptocephala]
MPGSIHDGYSNEQRSNALNGKENGDGMGTRVVSKRESSESQRHFPRCDIGASGCVETAATRDRETRAGYAEHGVKAARQRSGEPGAEGETRSAEAGATKRVGRTGTIGVEESGARIQNCVGGAGFIWRWPMREGTRGKERNVVRRQKGEENEGNDKQRTNTHDLYVEPYASQDRHGLVDRRRYMESSTRFNAQVRCAIRNLRRLLEEWNLRVETRKEWRDSIELRGRRRITGEDLSKESDRQVTGRMGGGQHEEFQIVMRGNSKRKNESIAYKCNHPAESFSSDVLAEDFKKNIIERRPGSIHVRALECRELINVLKENMETTIALREWQTRHCCGVRGHEMLCSSCCESESDTCSKRSRNAGEETTTMQGRRNASGLKTTGMLRVGVERERFGDDNEERGGGRFGYLRVLRCAEGGVELKRGGSASVDGSGARRQNRANFRGRCTGYADVRDRRSPDVARRQKAERGGSCAIGAFVVSAGGKITWRKRVMMETTHQKPTIPNVNPYPSQQGNGGA